MLRALREASEREQEGWSFCDLILSRARGRPSRRDRLGRARGRDRVVPLLRDRIVDATRSSISETLSRGGSTAAGSGQGRRWASSKRIRRSRTRCARPAGSRRRRSSALWARSAATSSSRRAAGTGGSVPCGSMAATAASPARECTASTPSLRTRPARRRTPRIPPPPCSRSTRRCEQTDASCRSRTSTAFRRMTTAR